jgi:hypothetical protein
MRLGKRSWPVTFIACLQTLVSANRHLRNTTMTDSDYDRWNWDLEFQSIDTAPQHALEPASVDGKTQILAHVAVLQLLMSPRLP